MKINWYNTKLKPITNLGIVHTIEKKQIYFNFLIVPHYNKKKWVSKSCMQTFRQQILKNFLDISNPHYFDLF